MVDTERWQPIPSLDGYEASSRGGVRSVERLVLNRWGGTHWRHGRVLATFRRKGGYLGGNASIEGQRLNFEVHVAVCEAFHGTRPAGSQVRHLNGDCLDNRPENLAWGTRSQNACDRRDHGHLTARGGDGRWLRAAS